jgi:hypothetical protein
MLAALGKGQQVGLAREECFGFFFIHFPNAQKWI